MPTEVLVIFALLPLLAYFVKGIVGAASAIVFNAALLLLLAFGLGGEVTLLDGLYWIALADCVTSELMVWLSRRELRLERPVLLLLGGMLPVSVACTLLLAQLDLQLLAAILAAAVTASGLWLIYSRNFEPISARRIDALAFPTGLFAGVLSGLYSMAGPVVILYLAAGSKDPAVIRARLVFISAFATLTRAITLIAGGVYNQQRLSWFALSVPALLLGLLAGNALHKHIPPRMFRIILGFLVAIAGIAAGLKVLS